MKLKGKPLQVDLGEFITLVDHRGTELTVMRKADLIMNTIKVDKTGPGNPKVIGGVFGSYLITIFI